MLRLNKDNKKIKCAILSLAAVVLAGYGDNKDAANSTVRSLDKAQLQC